MKTLNVGDLFELKAMAYGCQPGLYVLEESGFGLATLRSVARNEAGHLSLIGPTHRLTWSELRRFHALRRGDSARDPVLLRNETI